jgi:sodium transport system permease protein
MNLREIGVIYRKELRDSLRDRRTLISMIAVPLLLIPLLTVGVGYLSVRLIQESQKETVRVMVLGGKDSPVTLEALRQLPGVEVVPPRGDYSDEIISRTIRAAVRVPPHFDRAIANDKNATVTIYMFAGEMRSEFAATMLRRFFEQMRTSQMQARLQSHHLPSAFMQPLAIEEKNVAPPEKVGATLVGGLIPYFVIVLCLTGAMYPAIDMTAGEKERGTMETLLSSPASRTDLVLGKFLMVLTASLATGALAILSMAGSFFYAGKAMAALAPVQARHFDLRVDPAAYLGVFIMVVPVAVLFAGALLAIALFARSFREAQSYLSPLTIVVVAPAVMALVPGMELSSSLAFIPVLSTSLVSKEIMSGVYHWRYIALIFASSCLYAGIALAFAVRLFNREEVLFRT